MAPSSELLEARSPGPQTPEIYTPEIFKYPGGCATTFENKGILIRGCTNANTGFPWCMKTPALQANSKHPWAMCDIDNMPPFIGVSESGAYVKCKHSYNIGPTADSPSVWGCFSELDQQGQLKSPLQCKSESGELLRCLERSSDLAAGVASSINEEFPATVSPSDCMDTFESNGYSIRGCSNSGGVEWCTMKATGLKGVCNVNLMPDYFGRNLQNQVKKCDSMFKTDRPGTDGHNFAVFGCAAKISGGKVNEIYTCKSGNEILNCLDPNEQELARLNRLPNGPNSLSSLAISLIAAAVAAVIIAIVSFLVMRYRSRRNKVSYQRTSRADDDFQGAFLDKADSPTFHRDSTVMFESNEDLDERGGLLSR